MLVDYMLVDYTLVDYMLVDMARPLGHRLCEPYQRSISDRLLLKGRKNLDGGRSLPVVN